MSKLLVTPEGKLWTTTEGKALLDRPFNQEIVQGGLVFHGRAEYKYLTLVDGLVSEAYDVRGNGKKMVQKTVANQPKYVSENGIEYLLTEADLIQYLESTEASRLVSGFCVAKYDIPYNTKAIGIGQKGTRSVATVLGIQGSGFWGQPDYYYKTCYQNLTKNPTSNPRKLVILHSLSDIENTTPFVKILPYTVTAVCCASNYGQINSGGRGSICEWGWYDRVLSENEVIYNINALNAKYKCF